MAKQEGILQIKGTLDNLTFYKSQDGFLVRKKGGVSKNKIKNSSSYARTRENNEEFKQCAVSAKMLRKSVGMFVLKAKDSRLTSRLVQLFTPIKKLDTVHVRGARTVAQGLTTLEGKQLLKGFDFNNRSALSTVFNSQFDLNLSTGVITFEPFIALENMVVPPGATHFKLQCAYLNLDFTTGVFEVCYSPAVPFTIDETLITPVLTPIAVPSGTGLKLYFLLVEFYQEVNNTLYVLHHGSYNVLNILDVQ